MNTEAIRGQLLREVEELRRKCSIVEEIPIEEIRFKNTGVVTESRYQSVEQLPHNFRYPQKKPVLQMNAGGFYLEDIFYDWNTVLLSGILKYNVYDGEGDPVFRAYWLAGMNTGKLVSLSISGEIMHINDFSSIVQLYQRKRKMLDDNPPAPIKDFLYSMRKADTDDLDEILELFRNTIHTVNAKDYTPEQLATWCASALDREKWLKRIETQYFLVVEMHQEMAGFASLEYNGCIDVLYVHATHQRQGIARELLYKIEAFAQENNYPELWADVSITAKPFFTLMGFAEKRKYLKFLQGIEFSNTIMYKKLSQHNYL